MGYWNLGSNIGCATRQLVCCWSVDVLWGIGMLDCLQRWAVACAMTAETISKLRRIWMCCMQAVQHHQMNH